MAWIWADMCDGASLKRWLHLSANGCTCVFVCVWVCFMQRSVTTHMINHLWRQKLLVFTEECLPPQYNLSFNIFLLIFFLPKVLIFVTPNMPNLLCIGLNLKRITYISFLLKKIFWNKNVLWHSVWPPKLATDTKHSHFSQALLITLIVFYFTI